MFWWHRNGLDDGDSVLVTEILLYQHTLTNINLSFNQIGYKGMSRMCKVLKAHESLSFMNISHNNIGPAAGKDIGIWLKQSKVSFSLFWDFPLCLFREKFRNV